MSENPFKSFENKEPVKEEPVKIEPEKVKLPEAEKETSPTVLVTHTDAFIHERMKAQPKTLEAIEQITVSDTEEPNKHQLSLPDELKPFEDRFTFRWIFKSKRAIDEACDLRGWILLNRTHIPDLPKYLFTVNGSMERGDMICGFMPKAKAKALRERPMKESRDRLQATYDRHKDNPNFYVPKDEESSEVIGF